METASLLQAFFALVLVLALIGLTSIIYKKFAIDRNFMKGGKLRRLYIEEQIYLDSKRRLVLVKKDNAEYLLLLGQNGELLIDGTNPPPAQTLPKNTQNKKRKAAKSTH